MEGLSPDLEDLERMGWRAVAGVRSSTNRRAHWSNGGNALSSQSWGHRLNVQGTPVNDKTKLKRMELAIAKYNAMIRALKQQMKKRTADSLATRQAIARYQRSRDVLDLRLGLERIT
jgi:hypothetical protein